MSITSVIIRRPVDDPATAASSYEPCYARAGNFAAALNHDLAERRFDYDRGAPLSAVTAPTLVVQGSADPLFPPAHGEALAGQIPGVRLEVMLGMGHPFFSPGLTQRIADLIVRHTTRRQMA